MDLLWFMDISRCISLNRSEIGATRELYKKKGKKKDFKKAANKVDVSCKVYVKDNKPRSQKLKDNEFVIIFITFQ